jgi:hypothetical protein
MERSIMFKDKLLNVLRSKPETENNEEMRRITKKIEKQKRLSSREFLKAYDTLYKEGPKTKYQSPEKWSVN